MPFSPMSGTVIRNGRLFTDSGTRPAKPLARAMVAVTLARPPGVSSTTSGVTETTRTSGGAPPRSR